MFVPKDWAPPTDTNWAMAGRPYDDPEKEYALEKKREDYERELEESMYANRGTGRVLADQDFCDTVLPNVDWDITGRSTPVYSWEINSKQIPDG